jgi:hypothetical protein
MPRPTVVLILSVVLTSLVSAQNQPASNSRAVAYAARAVAALTGGATISDVTLTGSVTWNGSDTGTATLKALGTGESRIDLALTSGTRTEIRDAQTGASQGKWVTPNNSSGSFAWHNCQTDAVWYFPALGSLAAGQGVVLSYVGQESRNGVRVQHIQSHVYQNYQTISGVAVPMHIQRYQQGNGVVDLALSGASFNNGLQFSTFTIS